MLFVKTSLLGQRQGTRKGFPDRLTQAIFATIKLIDVADGHLARTPRAFLTITSNSASWTRSGSFIGRAIIMRFTSIFGVLWREGERN